MNKDKTPIISVIMGIYNSTNKAEVKKSLDSIANQTFQNWECIICDDGSTDDTYNFLQENYGEDKRFVIIQNEVNMGLCGALNNALSKAKGKYIVRQDTDDYSCIERFETLLNYMDNHDEVDVLGTGMIMYDQEGEWGHYKIRTLSAKKEDFLIGTVVAHPSVIMKTESIRACGGYRVAWETKRCEDYDMFMRMFKMGCKINNIEEELYYYKSNRNGNKRKFKNVIKECFVRYKGFTALEIGFKKWIYVFKPIFMQIIPSGLKRSFKNGEGK